jgi:hypothetical protein
MISRRIVSTTDVARRGVRHEHDLATGPLTVNPGSSSSSDGSAAAPDGWSRPFAVCILAATIITINGCLYGVLNADPNFPKPLDENEDWHLYRHVVERVHGGESYYGVAASELGFHGYPTSAVFHFRTPSYAWMLGAFPHPDWANAILVFAAVVALFLGVDGARREAGWWVGGLTLVTLGGALAWCTTPQPMYFMELWVGVLILLSLTAHERGLPAVGVVLGIGALFLRELALPFCVLSAVLALKERRPIESASWAAGIFLYGWFFLRHAAEVGGRLSGRPGAGVAQAEDWLRFGGVEFLASTARMNLLLAVSPVWCSAIFVPLALLGLAARRSQGSDRMALTAYNYVILFMIIGKSFNFYWGWICAPLLALGASRSPSCLIELGRQVCGVAPSRPAKLTSRAPVHAGALCAARWLRLRVAKSTQEGPSIHQSAEGDGWQRSSLELVAVGPRTSGS